MFSCLRHIQEFFSVRVHQIFKYIFSGRIILKHIENKKDCRGSGGVLPLKIFNNLYTVVAILVLFEQFLCKFCLNFLPLNVNVSPNIMHFVRTFSIMLVLGMRLIAIENFKIMEKLYSSKTCLKMAGGGMHSPHLYPLLPALITVSLTTTPTSRFGFNMT